MQKVHVRRFFIHVNLCGNDVFRADKLREEGFAFLEKTSGFFRGELFKKRAVRGHDEAAHMHGVFPHGLHQ